LDASKGWLFDMTAKRLRFTTAKAKAFNNVVPDFGMVANTTSVSLAWKCLCMEGDNGLDLRLLAPKPLELVDMRGSASSLFGKRKKKFLAFLA
jgi:hypothetical protein